MSLNICVYIYVHVFKPRPYGSGMWFVMFIYHVLLCTNMYHIPYHSIPLNVNTYYLYTRYSTYHISFFLIVGPEAAGMEVAWNIISFQNLDKPPG